VQHGVDQRGLAMVDVGDDGDVSDFLLHCSHSPESYSPLLPVARLFMGIVA
jgi:hypothetical protein